SAEPEPLEPAAQSPLHPSAKPASPEDVSVDAPAGILKHLFRGELRIGPGVYLMSGILIFSLKFLLDSLLAHSFHHEWGMRYYLEPSRYYNIWTLPTSEWPFFGMLVALSLPFMVVGVMLTLARIKDASLPRWIVLAFFIPLINLLV